MLLVIIEKISPVIERIGTKTIRAMTAPLPLNALNKQIEKITIQITPMARGT